MESVGSLACSQQQTSSYPKLDESNPQPAIIYLENPFKYVSSYLPLYLPRFYFIQYMHYLFILFLSIQHYFQQMELLPTTTCFGTCVPSSGPVSYFIYNDLHNRMQQKYQFFLQIIVPKLMLTYFESLCSKRPAHLTLLDLIFQIIFGKE
jgi:hypothetical protein